MVFNVNDGYKTVFNKLNEKNENTYIVQFGCETYEPVSTLNKEIETQFKIKETMEKVGKHKIPDCIITNKIFTLIVFDKNGKVNKTNILQSIKFLKLMCDKYKVKNLVFVNAYFGKGIIGPRGLKGAIESIFKLSAVNVYFTKRKD